MGHGGCEGIGVVLWVRVRTILRRWFTRPHASWTILQRRDKVMVGPIDAQINAHSAPYLIACKSGARSTYSSGLRVHPFCVGSFRF